MVEAAMQKALTAHQEQFGVQYLAQGHFSMQLGEAKIQTSNLPITRQSTLPRYRYSHPQY